MLLLALIYQQEIVYIKELSNKHIPSISLGGQFNLKVVHEISINIFGFVEYFE